MEQLVSGLVDILTISETKLDSSFPVNQFLLSDYITLYHLNVTDKIGGLHVNSDIPSKPLNKFKLPNDIQAISIELNLCKRKRFIVLSTDLQDFDYLI